MPSTSVKASSAGGAPRASVSAAATICSTLTTPLRRATPTEGASAGWSETMTMMVTERSRRTPLVVVELRAKRTSA
jgi:hypothetical protein